MTNYFLNNYQTNCWQKALFPLFSVYAARHFEAAAQATSWKGKTIHVLIGLVDWMWPIALIEKAMASKDNSKNNIKISTNSSDSSLIKIIWNNASRVSPTPRDKTAQKPLFDSPLRNIPLPQVHDQTPLLPIPQVTPPLQNQVAQSTAPIPDLAKVQEPLNKIVPEPHTEEWFLGKERQFIREAYQSHQGIVVGEDHTSRASMQFVINHLDLLAEIGVKSIGMEIPEQRYPDIETFFSDKNVPMTKEMEKELLTTDALNLGSTEFNCRKDAKKHLKWLIPYEKKQKYNRYHLFVEAQKRGIRIFLIDSYYCRPQYVGEDRIPATNEFAERKTRETIKGEKFLLFCGLRHAVPVETDPGLGKRFGIPVFRTRSGEKRFVTNQCKSHARLKPDYNIQYIGCYLKYTF